MKLPAKTAAACKQLLTDKQMEFLRDASVLTFEGRRVRNNWRLGPRPRRPMANSLKQAFVPGDQVQVMASGDYQHHVGHVLEFDPKGKWVTLELVGFSLQGSLIETMNRMLQVDSNTSTTSSSTAMESDLTGSQIKIGMDQVKVLDPSDNKPTEVELIGTCRVSKRTGIPLNRNWHRTMAEDETIQGVHPKLDTNAFEAERITYDLTSLSDPWHPPFPADLKL